MKYTKFYIFSLIFLIGCSSSEAPVDSAVESKIFHYGNGTEPQGLDPHIVTGVPEHHLLLALCEGLTSSNPKGGESLPGSAASWDISEDGKVYTFYLQENGKWSNGDIVTADDYVWSWQRILTPSLGSQYPDMLYYVVNAEEFHTGSLNDFSKVGVKAIDDLTLQVTLKEPTPFFLGLLSHYSTWAVHKETVLKHGTIDDRNGQWTRPGNFVCNGPFNLKSWELNKKIIVEKNPLYWDSDMVELNEMHFYPISVEMTEERMFRAGQLHVTSTFPSSKCTPDIKETNPNIQIHPYWEHTFIDLILKMKPCLM